MFDCFVVAVVFCLFFVLFYWGGGVVVVFGFWFCYCFLFVSCFLFVCFCPGWMIFLFFCIVYLILFAKHINQCRAFIHTAFIRPIHTLAGSPYRLVTFVPEGVSK